MYLTISEKAPDNLNLFENIIKHIEDDLENNNISEGSNEKYIINLRILNNISKFPIGSRLIVKNEKIFNNICNLMLMDENDSNNEQITLASDIFANLTENTANIEKIIDERPEIVEKLINNVLDVKIKPQNLNSSSNNSIIFGNVAALINFFSKNYTKLEKKGLANGNIVRKFIDKYGNKFPETNKLDKVLKLAEESDKKIQSLENLKKDKALISKLDNLINNNLKKNDFDKVIDYQNKLNRLSLANNVINRNSFKASLRKSKRFSIRNSIQSENLHNNIEMSSNQDDEYILSVKNNPRIYEAIDNIFQMLNKLHDELQNETDNLIKEEKNTLIGVLMKNLKVLSKVKDNQKTIVEMGLLKFLNKLNNINSKNKSLDEQLKLDILDVLQNCSSNENLVPLLYNDEAFQDLLGLILNENDHKVMNANEQELLLKQWSVLANFIKTKNGHTKFIEKYSNYSIPEICNLIKKQELPGPISIMTDILSNSLENSNKEEIENNNDNLWNVVEVSLNNPRINQKLMTRLNNLVTKIYKLNDLENVKRLEILDILDKLFEQESTDPHFIKTALKLLNKLVEDNNVTACKLIADHKIFKRINQLADKHIDDEEVIVNLSLLYKNLLKNNLDIADLFAKSGTLDNLLNVLESALEKDNIEAIKNVVESLNDLTKADDLKSQLSTTEVPNLLLELIDQKSDDPEIVLSVLKTIGNYLYKDTLNNLKLNMDLEELLQLLIRLQKKYYNNSDILIAINNVAALLFKLVKEKAAKVKVYWLISGALKIQDYNVPLVTNTLKYMFDLLSQNSNLIDEVFDDNNLSLLNLIKVHTEAPEVQILCFKILQLFSRNTIYAYTIINTNLIPLIKDCLTENYEKNLFSKLREAIYPLLKIFSKDPINATKISNILMEQLINDLKENNFEYKDQNLSIISLLTRHSNCREPFVQFSGIPTTVNLLKFSISNPNIIVETFNILNNVIEDYDEYKLMLSDLKVPDLILEIIDKSGNLDNRIEFEGRSLIFNINNIKYRAQGVDEISFLNVSNELRLKPEVKNFLTSGQIVTV